MISTYVTDKANEVLDLYAEVDGKIEEFKKVSSLKCVSGCGHCCENPKISITVLEAFPLACKLWQDKTAQAILDQIVNGAVENVCVFYQPDAVVAGSGRCGVYALRPLLCRLFGFSAKTNKYGKPSLVTCSVMKNHCAQEYEQVNKKLCKKTLAVPMMQEHGMQLLSIDFNWAREELPINQAIRMALEKVGSLDEK
jgi:Fe-S-cluster containining protein